MYEVKPDESPFSDPNELVVYGARDCCLCDEAMAVLSDLVREIGLRLRYIRIDGDPGLEKAYRSQIPVGFLGGRKLFKFRVDPERLRRVASRLSRHGRGTGD